MKGLLEVREFDKITFTTERKSEYSGYRYLPEEVFRDFENFIHDYTGDEDHADALEFLKISYRRNVGDIISVNNYVGLIQMKSGYQIQVLPKIDFGADPDSGYKETKRVFLKMLRSMKDFPSKVFNDANLKTESMTLYEIFVNIYLQQVRSLVKHGIKSAYVLREDNLKYFKGKLLANEHIKRNIGHKEQFYVAYDEYLVDRAENRLIKATLLKLQGITDSAENQRTIRQLLVPFEQVNESTNYQKDFSMVILDRSMKDYEMLIRWSKVFLQNKSFTTFSGGHNARALLFPMEKVFESYVAQELKKNLADLKWDVSAQDKGYYLFDFPEQFELRPDIVITRNDKSRIVLDTKWKCLIDKPSKNYGISQSDMYQMYAYAKKYNTPEVWLLYPLNEEMRNHSEISFKSNDDVTVRLFFVDVSDIESSLYTLRQKLIRE